METPKACLFPVTNALAIPPGARDIIMQATSMNPQPPASERIPEPSEITRLRERAAPDNPAACYALGEALLALGQPASTGEALNWFATAAQQDHPGGHYRMALYYRASEEKEMAGYHIRSAADGGHPAAKKVLHAWQVSGFLDFDDDFDAIRALEEAVREGSNEARYQLAIRLTQGRGIFPDPRRVAALYTEAAQQGYVPAMHGLGACYLQGYGIGQDDAQAFKWFHGSSRQELSGLLVRARCNASQTRRICGRRAMLRAGG
jgi:TPR repeat protein